MSNCLITYRHRYAYVCVRMLMYMDIVFMYIAFFQNAVTDYMWCLHNFAVSWAAGFWNSLECKIKIWFNSAFKTLLYVWKMRNQIMKRSQRIVQHLPKYSGRKLLHQILFTCIVLLAFFISIYLIILYFFFSFLFFLCYIYDIHNKDVLFFLFVCFFW